MDNIRVLINQLSTGKSFNVDEASALMTLIMEGEATPGQIGSILTALSIKGETAEEIAGMAKTMQDKSLSVDFMGQVADSCGTGGDNSRTFNISTTAALVASAAGLTMAKHGNRAASGTCGSADVLEALGVNIDLNPKEVLKCLDEVGFGFLFAPNFHPAMKYAGPIRKEIGIRTVFNILGPLTNPARAKHQLIGVHDPKLGPILAEVLVLMGTQHSMVVHGADGLDEISLGGTTEIWEVNLSTINYYKISPDEFGIKPANKSQLTAETLTDNVHLLVKVLSGEKGPHRDIVLLNTAGVLIAGNLVTDFNEGISCAGEAIDSGKAKTKLEELLRVTQSLHVD
ncbi:anthranilate phosphoribosyltransferase [SAR202 cluster bacterium AC-409-J13_OGT_754m]|nr:anthranilate phosphoribosyltransferase [SAR202 cluster bacterium AC-409-J13_OGT_754m]